MTTLLMAIATGLYSGYLPIAPGTWGSAVGLALFFALSRLSLPAYATVVVVLLVVGFFAAGAAEKILDRKDPGQVVIDEIVGMWASLLFLWRADWVVLVVAFLLFRAFDIWKFFPLNLFEGFRGGVGIVADDLAAGMLVNLLLRGILVAGFLPSP